MSNIILLVVGIVIGYIISKSFGRAQDKLGVVKEQAEEKKKNLEKVMEYFSEHKIATNNDIQVWLGVSDATATRYLDEMELWGKIRQVGRTGRQVTYEKV